MGVFKNKVIVLDHKNKQKMYKRLEDHKVSEIWEENHNIYDIKITKAQTLRGLKTYCVVITSFILKLSQKK